jgi:hypothetical protein
MRRARSFLSRTALLAASILIAIADQAVANDLPIVYEGAPPDAEFGAPYAIRVLPGGTEIEISGSFSWAVPQNFTAVLAGAPDVRAVRLESPGGYVQPALAVADIIRTRRLDTYVGRFCASACTLVFLGGQHRYLAPGARLGFHQAHAPNVAQARVDPIMRQAYDAAGVPSSFIDHVLHTPSEALWFPSRDELQQAGITSGPPPPALLVPDTVPSPAWTETIRDLRWASDDALFEFATATADLLGQLQAASPSACWDFTHHVPVEIETRVRAGTLDALKAALRHARDDVKQAPTMGLGAADKHRVLAALLRTLPTAAQSPTVAALRADADHAAFCPALRTLLNAALALPPADRGPALRALLSGQS